MEIYKTWNGKALLNFKWRVYGKYYYIGIWLLYIIFLTCFVIASSSNSYFSLVIDKSYLHLDLHGKRNDILVATIFLGCFHLSFEIRQFLWNPYRWLLNFWNLFGMY